VPHRPSKLCSAAALIAAAITCSIVTPAALGKPAAKRAQTIQQAETPASDGARDDAARLTRLRAQADKQQKGWDAKAAMTAKSICSNC
jgi:hypothetical protein